MRAKRALRVYVYEASVANRATVAVFDENIREIAGLAVSLARDANLHALFNEQVISTWARFWSNTLLVYQNIWSYAFLAGLINDWVELALRAI